MKREIRKVKIDKSYCGMYTNYNFENACSSFNLKILSSTLFPKFDEINDIECELDQLINSIKNPDDCQFILDKIEWANQIATNVHKLYNAHAKLYLCGGNS